MQKKTVRKQFSKLAAQASGILIRVELVFFLIFWRRCYGRRWKCDRTWNPLATSIWDHRTGHNSTGRWTNWTQL